MWILFEESLLRVEICVYWHHVFDYFGLYVAAPGSCPASPPHCPALHGTESSLISLQSLLWSRFPVFYRTLRSIRYPTCTQIFQKARSHHRILGAEILT